ncbi:lysophospholipase-like protein [Xylogone sp. PMI_703]|nr:lysophospholipase-like protein [Xylogone sp. PMI_703]
MKTTTVVTCIAASALAAANIIPSRDVNQIDYAALELAAPLAALKRALPNSPSGGYAPASVDCPTTLPTVRRGSTLSQSERDWLEVRRNQTIQPMINLLERANISGFDATAYINRVSRGVTDLPNIAIAASGGGYRALMNGAGFLAAADNRTTNSTGPGQIGGLLQATTYLAGLSGGGWLVGSLFSNNFSSVETLRNGHSGSSVWQFGNSIFEGPDSDGIQLLSSADYYSTIISEVADKADLGYNTSITDYWGRALSFQLVDATDGGPAYTFSSIALTDNFVRVADSRAAGTTTVALNSTLFEFNPFEFGSWDPTLYGFVPTEFLGTNFTDGRIPQGADCTRGFDQIGYVMGTSSTLFNQFILNINSTALPSSLTSIFTDILNKLAPYTPNPFFEYNSDRNPYADSKTLTLVDGGEDLQNIPLNPVIQPFRNVDVIFAIDSSADTIYNWPNGTAMVATYQRSLNASIQNGTAFPSIPDQNTFVNLGLNSRPTFFGCDVANLTGPTPLIVYVPNSPYIVNSNRNAIIENGYNAATQGNGTIDSQWSTCVACAILSRSFSRTNTTKYCWDGTINSTNPGNYTPAFKLTELDISKDGAASSLSSRTSLLLSGAVMLGVLALNL